MVAPTVLILSDPVYGVESVCLDVMRTTGEPNLLEAVVGLGPRLLAFHVEGWSSSDWARIFQHCTRIHTLTGDSECIRELPDPYPALERLSIDVQAPITVRDIDIILTRLPNLREISIRGKASPQALKALAATPLFDSCRRLPYVTDLETLHAALARCTHLEVLIVQGVPNAVPLAFATVAGRVLPFRELIIVRSRLSDADLDTIARVCPHLTKVCLVSLVVSEEKKYSDRER